MLIALVVVIALAFSSCGNNPSTDEAIPVDNVFTATNAPTIAPSATPTATPAGTTRARSGSGTESGSGSSSGGPQAAPAAPAAPKVTCPTGSVPVQSTTYAFKEYPIQGSDQSNWDVTVKGKATNNTSHSISSATISVDLRVPDTSGDSGTTTAGAMGTGRSAEWSINLRFASAGRPEHGDVVARATGWSYGDPALDRAC
jgi:hypothetical protein